MAGGKSTSATVVAEIIDASQSLAEPIARGSNKVLTKLTKLFPESCGHALDQKVEARRYKALTDKNLQEWHQGADDFLVEMGFAFKDPHHVSELNGGGGCSDSVA